MAFVASIKNVGIGFERHDGRRNRMAPGCSRRQLCNHNRAVKRSLDGCGRNFTSVTRFGQGFRRTGRNSAVVAAAVQVVRL